MTTGAHFYKAWQNRMGQQNKKIIAIRKTRADGSLF
jgi:hypothetical protein